jgi:hypothetical protein
MGNNLRFRKDMRCRVVMTKNTKMANVIYVSINLCVYTKITTKTEEIKMFSK